MHFFLINRFYRFVWAGTQNGEISIWHGTKKTLVLILTAHQSYVNSIESHSNDCTPENWVFTGDIEGNILFWNPYGVVKNISVF